MGQDKGKGRHPRCVRIERGRPGRAGGETAPEREPKRTAREGRPAPEELDLHTRIVVPRQARGAPPEGTRAEADIELREVRYGSTSRMPYLRVVPRQRMFTSVAAGELEATELASRPQDIVGRYLADIKRVAIGSPFAPSQAIHERLA